MKFLTNCVQHETVMDIECVLDLNGCQINTAGSQTVFHLLPVIHSFIFWPVCVWWWEWGRGTSMQRRHVERGQPFTLTFNDRVTDSRKLHVFGLCEEAGAVGPCSPPWSAFWLTYRSYTMWIVCSWHLGLVPGSRFRENPWQSIFYFYINWQKSNIVHQVKFHISEIRWSVWF